MKTLWQEETRAECMARARRLRPDSPRQWGTMNVEQLLAHMLDAFRMGLGELEVRPKKPAFGKLSGKSWGRLGYKHIDHQLRQFGV